MYTQTLISHMWAALKGAYDVSLDTFEGDHIEHVDLCFSAEKYIGFVGTYKSGEIAVVGLPEVRSFIYSKKPKPEAAELTRLVSLHKERRL